MKQLICIAVVALVSGTAFANGPYSVSASGEYYFATETDFGAKSLKEACQVARKKAMDSVAAQCSALGGTARALTEKSLKISGNQKTGRCHVSLALDCDVAL